MERLNGTHWFIIWAILALPFKIVRTRTFFNLQANSVKAQYAAVIAGFNMACSTAIMNSGNHDDLMAAASKFKHLPCKCSKPTSDKQMLKQMLKLVYSLCIRLGFRGLKNPQVQC